MNIANIFGLHIGCRVKHSFTHDNTLREGISLLTGVQILQGGTIFIEAGFKEYNHQFCKLILKPLSKITDEDKAEFQKKFCESYVKVNGFFVEDGQLKMKMIDTRSLSSTAILYDNLFTRAYPTLEESLWLASKGYDIALVPDEYKEVEE